MKLLNADRSSPSEGWSVLDVDLCVALPRGLVVHVAVIDAPVAAPVTPLLVLGVAAALGVVGIGLVAAAISLVSLVCRVLADLASLALRPHSTGGYPSTLWPFRTV